MEVKSEGRKIGLRTRGQRERNTINEEIEREGQRDRCHRIAGQRSTHALAALQDSVVR